MLSKGRKLLLVIIALLIAFLSGFLLQYANISEIRRDNEQLYAQLNQLQDKLNQAQFKLKLASLRDQLTLLYLEVLNKNFGSAQSMSTQFFDSLRESLSETQDSELKIKLSEMLQVRDELTSALARADTAISAKIQTLLVTLHQATRSYK